MSRHVRVLFYTTCATAVSVAVWIVAIVLNVMQWLFGSTEAVESLAWVIVLLSTAVFGVIFYKHFSRSEK
jgi:membrane protein YdbS with pleckstrin-like domain